MRNQGSQSNSKHAISVYSHSHSVLHYSSFTDSFIQDNVETHLKETINEGTTRMILIIQLNAWAAIFGDMLASYHFFIKSAKQV